MEFKLVEKPEMTLIGKSIEVSTANEAEKATSPVFWIKPIKKVQR